MPVNRKNIVASQQARYHPEKPVYMMLRVNKYGQTEKHNGIIRYNNVEYLWIAEVAPGKYRLLLHKPILVLRNR